MQDAKRKPDRAQPQESFNFWISKFFWRLDVSTQASYLDCALLCTFDAGTWSGHIFRRFCGSLRKSVSDLSERDLRDRKRHRTETRHLQASRYDRSATDCDLHARWILGCGRERRRIDGAHAVDG